MPLDYPSSEVDLESEPEVPREVLVESPTVTPRFSYINEVPPLSVFYIRDIEEANTRIAELEGSVTSVAVLFRREDL